MQRLNTKNINTPENSNKRFNGTVGLFDIQRFGKLARYFKGGKYLDLGAFDSIMPQMLAERFPKSEITVLDFADEIIDFLKPRFPKVNYICYDIRLSTSGYGYHLPFDDNTLDYVVAGEVIEHMEKPQWFIDELLRVVKPGGWVAISTPFDEISRDEKIGGPFHLWSYNEQDMKDLLGEPVEIEMILEGRYNTMMAWKQKK